MSAITPSVGSSLSGSFATLRFSARAMTWTPLLASAGALVVVGTAAVASGARLGELCVLGAATLAAGALATLHDRAGDLLDAVPVSPGRRRRHRVLLLAPAAVLVWAALLATAGLAGGQDAGWPMGRVAALLASGVAVATWTPRSWAVGAAVATPLVWFGLDRFVGNSQSLAGSAVSSWALSAWTLHPWAVVTVAVGVAVAGWRR